MAVLKGSLPRDWKGWNPREAPRQQVPEGLLVHAEIELANGTRWSGQCLNIGATGVLVQFPPDTNPEMTSGTKVLLTLKVRSFVENKIPCLVRHCQDHCLGLFFPEASRKMVDPQNHLTQIIRIIEREALRVKTNGALG